MIKWIKRIVTGLLLLIILASAGIYLFLHSSKPEYSGSVVGLTKTDVDVYFDDYGIPHIYAENSDDLYRAFGFVQAQERLFQMELMRRVGSGRLAAILGPELIRTDQMFRTIIDPDLIRETVRALESPGLEKENQEITAYLEGLNYFIDNGATPPEFSLKGITKTHFQKEDLFYIASYMAYGFAMGQKTDPLVDYLASRLDAEYLTQLGLHNGPDDHFIPSFETTDYLYLSSEISSIVDQLPVPVFSGSNSWIVSGEMTKSGKPIFCNDTHIAYSLPQTWYEAHLVGPDMDLYGNFLGGIPYALIGHNLAFTWGLTMLEQDDMDFYRETFDESGKKYFSNGIWFEAHERPESIAVLGGDTVTFVVRSTHHGPIVTDFYDLPENGDPISLWWDYTKYANKLLPAFRLLNHANNISDAEKAASLIHGPGLNLMAADTGGNIGWWACAKLLKRRNHVNSKLILRGTGEDDPLGAYPFSQNPKAINPPWNFVYSANDQPAPMDSLIYPGYYKPSNRADRIKELIVSRNDWTLEDMKDLMTDVTSTVDKQIAEIIAREIGILDDDRLELLADWNGSHEIDEIGPTIYYAVLYQILHAALADEMGDEGFDTFLSTHWMKKCYSKLISNPSNIWWDNTNTQQTETRSEILNIAWKKAVTVLETTFGTNLHEWTWGNAHSLELEHVFGKVSLLRPLFNLSKNATRGGFETINQASFKLNASGKYVTKVGSQMRIIHDLADINKSISISPSGQSGHPMSKHYGDQEKAYRLGLFRPQLRDERKVEKLGNHLRFLSF